jgi:hypothetical protein
LPGFTKSSRLPAGLIQTDMNSEIVTIDHDEKTSPHAQEVEFALILSRMINTAKQDPAQLRFTVYEFARSKLANDITWADEEQRKRLLASLEIAIKGVEQFSARGDQSEQLQIPARSGILALGEARESNQVAVVSARPDFHHDAQWKPLPSRFAEGKKAGWPLGWAVGGMLVVGAFASGLYLQRGSLLPPPVAKAPAPIAEVKPAPPSAVTFPLPTDYGIYLLNNGKLSELDSLSIQVPDKRVALSTPVFKESRTALSDGHVKFVAFRRDLAADAPDRVEVRIVAEVSRAVTFDAKGKPSYSPVSGEWSIRNTSYEFRVRPIAGNPEMLLIQSENPDFVLPAGRYVIALKNQGFDFTIAGEVTDSRHCLERTDAANGTFYADCKNQ